MTSNSCHTFPASHGIRKGCHPVRQEAQDTPPAGLERDLDIGILRQRVAAIGNPDSERVYGYVVRTVRPNGDGYIQTGSAPNFAGGLITLCTCKHSMRASLTAEQWKQGIWIAGLTSYDLAFHKQQSLVYLMRVGEAYPSQADLVQALRDSGRSAVVDAKCSTRHALGDLMLPARDELNGDERFQPSAYSTPMLGHAHRQKENDTGWHDDIDYMGRSGRRAAMLIGDREFSFFWSRPMICRRHPGPTRPYREWSMNEFLDDIDAAPTASPMELSRKEKSRACR